MEKYVVRDVRRRGTIVEFWLSKDSDEDTILLLEVSYSWERSKENNHDFDPVFESAFLSHPGTDAANHTTQTEEQVDDLVGDWGSYVSKG